MYKLLSATALAAAMVAAPAANAAVVFTSTFESVPGAPSNGNYSFVQNADGWTATDANHPIELQNHVAGAPQSPDGGNIFVELDSSQNSSMSRVIGAGTYLLSFLYSPRPGQSSNTNGIEVLLNNVLLNPPGTVTGSGGANTNWSTITSGVFTVGANTTLTFRAVGNSDSYGGYVDNITLTAVPEPATWAMLIAGFGMIGAALRRRSVRTSVTYA